MSHGGKSENFKRKETIREEAILKEIMAETFPKLMKLRRFRKPIKSQEGQIKILTPRHISVKVYTKNKHNKIS